MNIPKNWTLDQTIQHVGISANLISAGEQPSRSLHEFIAQLLDRCQSVTQAISELRRVASGNRATRSAAITSALLEPDEEEELTLP